MGNGNVMGLDDRGKGKVVKCKELEVVKVMEEV